MEDRRQVCDINDFYTNVIPVSGELLRTRLEKNSSLRNVRKGDVISAPDKSADDFIFLVDGIARGFFLDDSSRDVTVSFKNRPGEVLMWGRPVLELNEGLTFEMLTDGTVLLLPSFYIRGLQTIFPEILRILNKVMSNELLRFAKGKLVLYRSSSKDRYTWFLKEYEGLIDVVKHKYIASFLGMSPVTLSRIRGREKKQIDG